MSHKNKETILDYNVHTIDTIVRMFLKIPSSNPRVPPQEG